MIEPAINLVTTRPDAEIAADLRKRAEAAFDVLGKIMDEANAAGLVIGWGGMALQPPMGRHKVVGLTIAKHF